jgi:aminoglycoside phosphotransferase (APT) family kinase protein
MTTVTEMTTANPLTDIVDTYAQARACVTPPLIVREGLRSVLNSSELPRVERVNAGHSNPTFAVEARGSRWILRRPPRPPFAASAHDVMREYRLLAALAERAVRAPAPFLACEDPSVLGAPFYLMHWIDGWVLRDSVPEVLEAPGQRELVANELVDALVELHAVEPAAVSGDAARRGSAYLARQLDTWSAQWRQIGTPAVPDVERVERWLRASIPSGVVPTLVHGDYKLDNVIFAAKAPPTLLAILDWELATVGDPLADLGYLTGTWVQQGEDPMRVGGVSTLTSTGFPGRRTLIERYARASGRDVDGLAWYQTLGLWKLAILLEASRRRYALGTIDDAYFSTLDEVVPHLASEAVGASQGSLI